jgi:hypothetical protein
MHDDAHLGRRRDERPNRRTLPRHVRRHLGMTGARPSWDTAAESLTRSSEPCTPTEFYSPSNVPPSSGRAGASSPGRVRTEAASRGERRSMALPLFLDVRHSERLPEGR